MFTRVTASAPAPAAASATTTIEVTFGVNLAMTGSRQARTNSADEVGSHLRIRAEIDPAADVGAGDIEFQRGDLAERTRQSRAAIATNSSASRPAMFTTSEVPSSDKKSRCF